MTLSFRIIDNQNNPISFTGVRITNTDNLDSRISYTDNNGRITGLVYSNANLKMEFLGNCNETIFIRNIAPLNSNVDLGDIVYNPNPLENIDEVKSNFVKQLTGMKLGDRYEYIKFYFGSSNNESAAQKNTLIEIGSVYFYHIDFNTRSLIYQSVFNEIEQIYGSFLDGYIRGWEFIVQFINGYKSLA